MTTYNRIAGGEVGRIAALSDGVFAFAATVLVLDVRTPEPADIASEAALASALWASAPRLLPWLLSLLTLGIFWLGQQTQLSRVQRSDRNLAWLHFVFLAVVAALPFSTRLLAGFLTYRTAFLVYWTNILLLGGALYTAWAYAERARLLQPRPMATSPARCGGGSSSRRRSMRSARSWAWWRPARHRADHPHPAQLRARPAPAAALAPVAVRTGVSAPPFAQSPRPARRRRRRIGRGRGRPGRN